MRKRLWMLLVGVAVAIGDVCLAERHTAGLYPGIGLLPEFYGTALAAWFFHQRSGTGAQRERSFWRLWAIGCALWSISDLVASVPGPANLASRIEFVALAFTYIPKVVMMAALVLQPEASGGELREPVVRFEAALLGLWWIYLYLIVVIPWNFILPNPTHFWASFVHLHELQNALTIVSLAALARISRGSWRRVYTQLTGAFSLLAVTIGPMHVALDGGNWPRAMVFEGLVAAAFLWMGAVAAFFITTSPAERAGREQAAALGSGSWLAPLTAFGIPLVAAWAQILSGSPAPVRQFRLYVSFAAVVAGTWLVYKRQDAADQQSGRLLAELESSVQNLRELHGQFAEAEKLASLGQLAAGAAHEINNPAAAILGYSELLSADSEAPERSRELARKVGQQARRIRSLVHNVLGLTQQEASQGRPVDVADVVRSAAELHRLRDSRPKPIVVVHAGAAPLEVKGDANKLLQVFYGLLAALSEGGDGRAELTAHAERKDDRVIVEFIRQRGGDSGEPECRRQRDAAKGQALSLGICHALIREHGGSIVPENPPSGGRGFLVELPALQAAATQIYPRRQSSPLAVGHRRL